VLEEVYHGLRCFRSAFSRERSWLLFCAVVLGLLAAPEMIGVSSLCRFWGSGERGYHRLLHFFRSQAYRREGLLEVWQRYVVARAARVEVDGRCVVLGDHTHVVKDGGRMPGVVSLRQLSETQRKPSYFRGQCWGAVGLLVGSLGQCFCLPLELAIHQGFGHLGREADRPRLPLGERVLRMVQAFALRTERPARVVLDAFFASAGVFRHARSLWSIELRQPLVHVLVRAKKHFVAYLPPAPKPAHRRGPAPRYGQKLYLQEVFDHPHLFTSLRCSVYGREETVRVFHQRLLWKPLGDWVLFIWVISSRGPLVLMSSDLTLCPRQALLLYCARTRIETLFDVLKNLLHAFAFRFWTPALPRHSRRPCANTQLKAPAPNQRPAVAACWRAQETFVLCAAVAQGLLQLLALNFSDTVWQQHRLFLRTRSRLLPSEKTVRQVLTPLLLQQLLQLPENSILHKIRRLLPCAEDENADARRKAA